MLIVKYLKCSVSIRQRFLYVNTRDIVTVTIFIIKSRKNKPQFTFILFQVTPETGKHAHVTSSNIKDEEKTYQVRSNVGGGKKENKEERNAWKEKNVLLLKQES